MPFSQSARCVLLNAGLSRFVMESGDRDIRAKINEYAISAVTLLRHSPVFQSNVRADCRAHWQYNKFNGANTIFAVASS